MTTENKKRSEVKPFTAKQISLVQDSWAKVKPLQKYFTIRCLRWILN